MQDTELYIVVCCGSGKNDHKPIAATFGVFRTMQAARAEIERIKRVRVHNHFADNAEWFVSQDLVIGGSRNESR